VKNWTGWPDGAGKSTLFALLNGQLQEEKGELEFPAHWRLSQVEQHMPESEESASEFVLAADTRLAQAQAQKLLAAERLDDGMAIAESYMALADAGAHDAMFGRSC
jgi:ATP-binding cassette subfamily F protein 3